MSDFGIICEFNPFHNGHKYLIDEARRLGAGRIVCVMSGNAVQRGELALADKYERAEIAVREGADLVLELPYPWSASSAEFFGRAAIETLQGFCDTLIFGSECGDIEVLRRAAEISESDSFKEEYEKLLEAGEGAASAYAGLLEKYGCKGLGSNDLLGISYIRGIIKTGADISPITVKRQGATINEENIIEGSYQSATALRELINNGDIEKAKEYMGEASVSIINKSREDGKLTDISLIERAMLMYFRLADAEELGAYADLGGGIAERICKLSHEAESFSELFEKFRTKRYTDAKLRRAILFALTKVRADLLSKTPEYTLLLGANKKGREMLSENRKAKDSRVRVITKPADAPRDSEEYRVSSALEAIFSLARSEPLGSYFSLKKGAFIID